jgi:hypothetical protein
MSTDTAVCEVCSTSSYDNEDPVTGEFWCHTCNTWCFFKWPKTGERITKRTKRTKPRPPPCARTMGCLCAGHARGDSADAPCNTDERG